MTEPNVNVDDKVRVTDVFEGEVIEVTTDGFYIQGSTREFFGEDDLIGTDWKRTIEKLADPEPEWVNGDLIEVTRDGSTFVMVRVDGRWQYVNDGMLDYEVAEFPWAQGWVKILYKADR
jgi:hypothetical protein